MTTTDALSTPVDPAGSPFDPVWFRNVLGHFPTGVVVVTAMGPDGPAGMAVGSFTSVSLAPPLVAFLPDRRSGTFPVIREAQSFCVNVLSADQAELCRQFARSGTDKYAGVRWEPCEGSGAPRLVDSVAWLDCSIADVHEAGDHYIVVGNVESLGLSGEVDPLLFFQGGYGRFSSLSLAMASDAGMVRLMRQVELIRPRLERLAADLDMEAIAIARQGDQMLIVASALTAEVHGIPTRVGQRLPLSAPLGALLVAWEDEQTRSRWLDSAPLLRGTRADYAESLDRVRERGWSVGLMSPAYRKVDQLVNHMSASVPHTQERDALSTALSDLSRSEVDPMDLSAIAHGVVRNISVPVMDTDGTVAFAIGLVRERQLSLPQFEQERDWILAAARQMTQDLAAHDVAVTARD